jgi:hypothetical protein
MDVMDTLQSIENLPSEHSESMQENNDPINFRFLARNIEIDWRSVSMIDIDTIAHNMDIPALQVKNQQKISKPKNL